MQKFLVTKELGRLAKWLRILGFDTRYEPTGNKSVAMLEALKEERVLVTRNARFGRRHGGTVVFVKHDEINDQLKDLATAIVFKIDKDNLFSRCIICNEPLVAAPKAAVENEVPAYVYQTQERFMRCPKCLRVYWKGTHWGNVEEALENIGIHISNETK